MDKKKALDIISTRASDEEIERRIAAVVGGNNSIRYQYQHVSLEYVMANPQEYIIPECLLACELLWDKNIETFMVSNYDDNHLYVLLDDLSDENLSIIKDLSKTDSRYFWDGYRHTWGIGGSSVQSSEELAELTNVFVLQDTNKYQTEEEFLDSYKRTGGKSTIDEYGYIVSGYNPDLANATLEEALMKTNSIDLYIPEEGRIYDSPMYLKWHNRYKDSLNETTSRK